MISKDEVKHIAELARVGLSEKEVGELSADLSSILDWIKQLEKADIKNTEAISHITGLSNIAREDKEKNFGGQEEIKKLFPEEKNGYGKVRSVL